eukprot:gb/GEZN01001165.1/.p1 GENE.gb/GEZN01001165.1/~~gb/GEZN01001165.1/.p1  ORF type:complete len:1011 (+),score=127.22 gb/GEZN01001165.1/:69-3101(+)
MQQQAHLDALDDQENGPSGQQNQRNSTESFPFRSVLSERRIFSRVGSLLKRLKSREEWANTSVGLNSDSKQLVYALVPPKDLDPSSPLALVATTTKGLPSPTQGTQVQKHLYIPLRGSILYLPCEGEDLSNQSFAFELVCRARQSSKHGFSPTFRSTELTGRSHLLACQDVNERTQWVQDILQTGVVQLRTSMLRLPPVLTTHCAATAFWTQHDRQQFGRHGKVRVQLSAFQRKTARKDDSPGQQGSKGKSDEVYWLRFFVHNSLLQSASPTKRTALQQQLDQRSLQKRSVLERSQRASLQCFPWPDMSAGRVRGGYMPAIQLDLERGSTILEEMEQDQQSRLEGSGVDEDRKLELTVVSVSQPLSPTKNYRAMRWRLLFADSKSQAGWRAAFLHWLKPNTNLASQDTALMELSQQGQLPSPTSPTSPRSPLPSNSLVDFSVLFSPELSRASSEIDVSSSNEHWLASATKRRLAVFSEDKENDKANEGPLPTFPSTCPSPVRVRSTSDNTATLALGRSPSSDKENATPHRRRRQKKFVFEGEGGVVADYDLSESESETEESALTLDPSRKLRWSPTRSRRSSQAELSAGLSPLLENTGADAKVEICPDSPEELSPRKQQWAAEMAAPAFQAANVVSSQLNIPPISSSLPFSPGFSVQDSISAKTRSPMLTTLSEKWLSPQSNGAVPLPLDQISLDSPDQTPFKGDQSRNGEKLPMPDWSPCSNDEHSLGSTQRNSFGEEINTSTPQIGDLSDKFSITEWSPAGTYLTRGKSASVSTPGLTPSLGTTTDTLKSSAVSAARKIYNFISPAARKLASPWPAEQTGRGHPNLAISPGTFKQASPGPDSANTSLVINHNVSQLDSLEPGKNIPQRKAEQAIVVSSAIQKLDRQDDEETGYEKAGPAMTIFSPGVCKLASPGGEEIRQEKVDQTMCILSLGVCKVTSPGPVQEIPRETPHRAHKQHSASGQEESLHAAAKSRPSPLVEELSAQCQAGSELPRAHLVDQFNAAWDSP